MAKRTPPTKTKPRQEAIPDTNPPARARRQATALSTIKEPDKEPDLVKVWTSRVTRETKVYKVWADDYEVERLARYYLGKQWRNLAKNDADAKYVINLIFASVETQLPSLMFARPKVQVEPRPTNVSEQPGSDVSGRGTLIESTLQTFIDKPSMHFKKHTELALRDTYWRFGIVEVGYTSNWVDNPNAGRPVLKDDTGDPMLDRDQQPVLQPAKVQTSEDLFLKRIPPDTFLVSPGRNILTDNDWCGYFEWNYVDDVKGNPDYENTEGLKASGRLTNTTEDVDERGADQARHAGQVKLWKVWDLRAKKKYVFADGHAKMLSAKPWTHLPLKDLKFYEIPDSFYPLPPLYNWMKPQDEINESREMQKLHRRRFVRRYMREPQVRTEEFDKLEAGEDGVCIEVPKVDPSPIAPIPDAPLDNSNWTQLAASKDDFMQISGVSGEARGIPESDTATQANIINARATLRESSSRLVVAEWLAGIVELMLLTIREKMRKGMVVKMNVDPFAPAAKDVAKASSEWREVQSKDLDLEVEVKVDITSLSPVAEDTQRAQWNNVLQLLTSQGLMMLLMTPNPEAPDDPSPLLRKTLVLNGVKSDQEIREIWRMGQAAIKAAAAAEAAKMQSDTKPDPPKISYSFKGEDLANPLVLAAFINAEHLGGMAAAAQPAAPVPSGNGNGGGSVTLPATPSANGGGNATGVPASVPVGG